MNKHITKNGSVFLMESPFGNIFAMDDEKHSIKLKNAKLDAIYIPTLASKKDPVSNIDHLLEYADEVVLLYTDAAAPWTDKYKKHVRIEYVNQHMDFSAQYFLRRENQNVSVKWRPTFDIPLKRSFALFDAKRNVYRRILLLDDDIFLQEQSISRGMIGLYLNYAIVGFHVVDFPDVSTIDHLERLITKTDSIISMTGSCMFLNIDYIHGDFLNIYNEDLFFYLTQPDPNKVVSGGVIYQQPSKPWLALDRIQHEQFGDLIYEALKKRFLGFTGDYINWADEIEMRVNRLEALCSSTTNESMRQALKAAINAVYDIEVQDIEKFIKHSKLALWATKYINRTEEGTIC